MTFFEAIEQVYKSDGKLMCGPTSIPGDAIVWDSLAGWQWVRSGAPVTLFAPAILFGSWLVGERPDEEWRR